MSEFTPVDNPVATITLNEPIQYMGDPILEIKLRAPIAADLLHVGNPVKIKSFDPVEIEYDDLKAMKMISRLTGKPGAPVIPVEGSLDRMSCNDAVMAFYAIAPFFIPGFTPPKPVTTT